MQRKFVQSIATCGIVGWYKKFKGEKLSLHSKIVLITTVALITLGTLGYYVFEAEGNLIGLTKPQKILSSLLIVIPGVLRIAFIPYLLEYP